MSPTETKNDSPSPLARQIAKEGRSEAFIPYPPLGDNLEHVPIHVRPEIHYYIARMGFFPNAIKLYLHVPWVAEFLCKLNNALMRDERNALSEHFKYRLALLASWENECSYCTTHHAATLERRWGYGDELLKGVLAPEGPADEREAVAMEFVRQTSRDPAGVSDELRARLAEQFTPQEVMEIVTLVGFWKMYNIMHVAMNVPLEDPVLAYRCWADYSPGPTSG